MPSTSPSSSSNRRLDTPSPAFISSPEVVDDDSFQVVSDPEHDSDAYELRPLGIKQEDGARDDDNEHGPLLGSGDEEEDEEEHHVEVMYDAGGGPSVSAQKPRRGRRKEQFLYTRAEERAVVRRMDRFLVVGLALLYMLSFLDRSNIGNAKIAGLMEDLQLDGDRYEWLLSAFYITYIAFEWMTLCWKMFPAHVYVAACAVGWGAVACLQALAWNWESMIVLRALLGICEAAFGPGVPFYLSLFYRREELAFRTGLFISAAPLATAYAGFLASAIISIPSVIAPWRVLYIAEGFPSIIAGIISYFWIPDDPMDARFLNRDQKRIARRRLLVVREDDEDIGVVANEEEGRGVKWREVVKAMSDMGNWITALMFFSINVSFSSLPVFLPTIINEMGYTATTAQLLSTPPYILGFFMVILMTWLSDKYVNRSYFLLSLCLTSACGYLLLAAGGKFQEGVSSAITGVEKAESGTWWEENSSWLHNGSLGTGIRYTGVMLAGSTVFSISSLVIVWNGNNMESDSARGAGMALLHVLGQCGPLVGTRVYPKSDGPYFVKGSVVCAVFMGLACLLAMIQRWRLKKINERNDREEAKLAGMEGGMERGRKKRFRYIL